MDVLFNPNTRRKFIKTREVIKLEASGSLTEQTWIELAITNDRATLVVSDVSLNETDPNRTMWRFDWIRSVADNKSANKVCNWSTNSTVILFTPSFDLQLNVARIPYRKFAKKSNSRRITAYKNLSVGFYRVFDVLQQMYHTSE